MSHIRIQLLSAVVTTVLLTASCGSGTRTTAVVPDPLICETQLDEIVSLFQSGLPTYDYDPFPSTTSLLEGSELVVFGTIDSLSRKTAAKDGLTIAAVSNVEIVHPADLAREVESVGWSSWWADSSNDDPLAEVVAIEGLEFVAFLTVSAAGPGGLTPQTAGTRWDAERQVVTTPNGDEIGMGDEAYGSGGYGYLDSVKTLLGRDAAALAERCVDNEYGEIAIVNNYDDAIGRR